MECCLISYQKMLDEHPGTFSLEVPPRTSAMQSFGRMTLRLLFMLATDNSSLRMFLNIWRQILFPEDLHDPTL